MSLVRSLMLSGVFLCVFGNTALALDSEEALVVSCEQYIENKPMPEDTICYEYVTGFIDGAILTDTAIIENIKGEKKEFSDFFERALKTRGMKRERETLPATYYANFCLPEDKTRHEIVEQLVYSINPEELGKIPFKNSLYNTLKRIYSCE